MNTFRDLCSFKILMILKYELDIQNHVCLKWNRKVLTTRNKFIDEFLLTQTFISQAVVS